MAGLEFLHGGGDGGDAGAHAGKKKWLPFALIGALGVVGFMIYRHMASGVTNAAAASPTIAGNGVSNPATTPGNLTGQEASNLVDMISTQYAALASQINPATPITPTAPPVQTGSYKPLTSWASVFQSIAAGLQVFYQPTPGNYVPIPPEYIQQNNPIGSKGGPEIGVFGNNIPTYIWAPDQAPLAPDPVRVPHPLPASVPNTIAATVPNASSLAPAAFATGAIPFTPLTQMTQVNAPNAT